MVKRWPRAKYHGQAIDDRLRVHTSVRAVSSWVYSISTYMLSLRLHNSPPVVRNVSYEIEIN